MSQSPPSEGPGGPAVDVAAVLAAMQDQLDDLAATVQTQQQTIDELVAAQRAGRSRGLPANGPGPAAGRR